MDRANAELTAIAVLVGALTGCASAPKKSQPRTFASHAVITEMHDSRPAFTALTPSEQAAVQGWLLANCAVGAEGNRAQLARLGPAVELAFIEAFRMGPPNALLAELAELRRRDFSGIQERLAGEDSELFDAELGQRLKGLSEDVYVSTGVDGTIAAYQLAALDALALVGSPTSIAWLERTAPTLKGTELKHAAERTLAMLRERSRR